MDRWIRSMIVLTCVSVGLLGPGRPPVNAQSDACADMKKDISEMKADLKDYETGGRLDPQDIAELQQEAADIKKDLNEYLTDPQSEPSEISKAKEGLQLVARMEEELREGRKGKILASYSKIIEVYDWFYDDEECE